MGVGWLMTNGVGGAPVDWDARLRQALDLVLRSRRTAALAGAGMSAESGIPTYRGAGGLWNNGGPPPLLAYREFLDDPAGWWRQRLDAEQQPGHPIYEMKQAVDQAQPNAGHYALAEMERRGWLDCIITQNVDGLHTLAGSRAVVEIHGNRNYLRCLQCGRRTPRGDAPPVRLPPLCADCGGVLKPDTVMFGEPIPPAALEAGQRDAAQCEVMLLLGTSGTVQPAARLPLLARESGAALIEINPETTPLTPWCAVKLPGPAGVALRHLLQWLMQS